MTPATSTTEAAEADSTTHDEKTTARLIAALAMRGHVVHRLADGGFAAGRWGHVRELPSLHELRQFAKQVGAIHG